jgi:oxygen-independent coproporphyrinogen III oxidase
MSGIYIHIPFCKKACHYCNFHFSTSMRLKEDMIRSICQEVSMRYDYLEVKTLNSIYFGGGTPSLLDERDLNFIFEALSKHFNWSSKAEITLEANPDDLSEEKLGIFYKSGINRLSIGVQSFFDEDLKWMNRAHNANEALSCIKLAQDFGFENLTIDLIYGSPVTTKSMWEYNINQALLLDIPHISSYCLTVEEKTALHHQVKTGKSATPDQEKANEQFLWLMDTLRSQGFDHYEISNFAKPGRYAIHNTNYWKGAHFLGLGPAAHSYDGFSRSWNIANNKKYIELLRDNILPIETEILSDDARYNEYVMTGLRTIWGVGLKEIASFGMKYQHYFIENIAKDILSGDIMAEGERYYLTQKGKFFADRIAMDLFYV